VIFVTIGSMFPFDRLIRRMDEVAQALPQESFFAQIGEGEFQPAHMEYVRMLDRRAFLEKLKAAKLLVAHAGMGSVISALEVGTPMLLLPRQAKWGEVNTDHQVATARWLQGRQDIRICFEDVGLPEAVAAALSAPPSDAGMSRTAPKDFTDKIKQFISAA
jgi:UDP-N-acetylglucosamine transferase subunit ALG13